MLVAYTVTSFIQSQISSLNTMLIKKNTSRELPNAPCHQFKAPNEHYTTHIATKPCTTQYIAQQPIGHNQTSPVAGNTTSDICISSPDRLDLVAWDRIGPVASKANPMCTQYRSHNKCFGSPWCFVFVLYPLVLALFIPRLLWKGDAEPDLCIPSSRRVPLSIASSRSCCFLKKSWDSSCKVENKNYSGLDSSRWTRSKQELQKDKGVDGIPQVLADLQGSRGLASDEHQ